jgi:hypothetical protein
MAGTRRTPINRSLQQRISPRAIELFAYLLKRERRADFSPDDPDYNDAARALHSELCLPPWAPLVSQVDERDRPLAGTDPLGIERRVIALRRELLLLTRLSRRKATPLAAGSPSVRGIGEGAPTPRTLGHS